MKPVITKRPLREYSPRRQRELCTCKVSCGFVFMIVQDEAVIQLCEKGAGSFAYTLMQTVGAVSKPVSFKSNIWPPALDEELIQYVKSFKGKVPMGAYTKFGKIHNKTRDQVKGRIDSLKKQGYLPYVRDLQVSSEKK